METDNQTLEDLIAAEEDTEEETIIDRSSEASIEVAHQCEDQEVAWAEEDSVTTEATTFRVAEGASGPQASEAHHQCHSITREGTKTKKVLNRNIMIRAQHRVAETKMAIKSSELSHAAEEATEEECP